ncbi:MULTISPECIES: hypothetical protein [Solibacillus]|uniref:Uncharacterized protein n=1 Tax=Solibacillus merdavium TaxID=2762218 RepID=A0ABR8XSF8_9BACL|nr:hypothetical protein [Solibacillus merdavium]MBD8034794.1 hypothetical protein [Solibacillus merdavium]
MKNNYNIIVHVVNLLLLGAIGFLAFFSVVNISPVQESDMFKFGLIVFLLAMWAVNYWFQYKKQKWILPIAGTVLYIAIVLFVLGIVMPFLNEIVY